MTSPPNFMILVAISSLRHWSLRPEFDARRTLLRALFNFLVRLNQRRSDFQHFISRRQAFDDLVCPGNA